MALKILGKGKAVARQRRHARLRKKIRGTAVRPRLVVTRSTRHMVAQVVDDTAGKTLVSASTLEVDLRSFDGDKTAKSRKVGELIAERAKAAGIDSVVLTAVETSTTAVWRQSQRAPAKVVCHCDLHNRFEAKDTLMAAGQRNSGAPTGGANEQNDRRNSRGRGEGGGRRGDAAEKSAFVERVVTINRVAKVVKGGRRFSFTALVVVGDGDGTVGVGYGKAKEVPAAIAKGVEEAKKNFFRVPRIKGTITHPVQGEKAAGVVFLRPAAPGTGVIAGGPVRAVLECAGVHDILSKSLGSTNAINIVHATVDALKQLEEPAEVAARRGLPLDHVAPAALLRAQAEGKAAQSAEVGA